MGRKAILEDRPAFTLVASLALASLVLLTTLGMASLTLAESRRGWAESARALAEIETRAALRIALGELQTAVGPDRRATAESAILGEHANEAPHWTGVWRTERLNTEGPDSPPFVFRDTTTGALCDRRKKAGYEAHKEVMAWLVSDGTGMSGKTPKELLGEKTLVLVDRDEAEEPIAAPAIPMGSDSTFAWWAGDEGVKARDNLPKLPEPEDPNERRARLAPSPCHAMSAIPEWRIPEEPIRFTPGTDGDSAFCGGLDTEARRRHFHDITAYSLGVLADQHEGGLRIDLTPFLLSTGKTSELSDDAPIIADKDSPFKIHGPRFGLLRAWAKLGEAADGGMISPHSGTQLVRTKHPAPADTFHDGTHASLPDVAAMTSPVVAPVVIDAAVYHRLGYEQGVLRPDGAPWLRLHLYPRLALWNPYDATLAPARYLLHLRVGGSPEFRFVNCGKRVTGRLTGWRVYRDDEVNYATTQGSLVFVVDCPAIPPGKSQLFLPARTAAYDVRNPGANRLTPATSQGNTHFFLEDTDGFESAGLKSLAGVSLDGESWRLENSAAEDHAVALKLLPGSAAATDWASLRLYPTVRFISLSHKCGVGTTADPAWPAAVSQPLLDSWDASPAPMTRDGVRLRRLDEHPGNLAAFSPAAHLDVAALGDHNPTAPFSFRHPFDNATPQEPGGRGVRRPEYFGAFTRDAFDSAADWESLAPVGDVTATPFGTPSALPKLDSVIATPLPPTPQRITSMGDFAHAPLFPWAWQPSRILGESRISPNVPPDATAHGVAKENWHATGVGAKHFLDWTRRDESPGTPLVHDARFEINHALLDRYCILSGNTERRRSFLASPGESPLPNTRLTPVPGIVDPENRLTGEHSDRRGASAVLTTGAFNINSVSETAWRALLGATRDRAPDGGTGAGSAFPRSARAPRKISTSASRHDTPEHWNNSRSLDDAELDRLAKEIVAEVKSRGPFLSLSDFSNRRLESGEVSRDPTAPTQNACGALQAAIDKAGLNADPAATRIPRESALPGTLHRAGHKAWQKTEGAASRLSQGDILRAIGPVIAARSDTFRLRVRVETGNCSLTVEAIVQRTPAPLIPNPDNPEEPDKKSAAIFGRRLVIVRLRGIR